MKKVLLCSGLMVLFLSGCGAKNADSTETKLSSSETTTSGISTKKETSKNSKSENSSDSKPVITTLNTAGNIEKNGVTMYTIEAREVLDVTDKAKSNTVNNSNALDYFSDNQAKQAVRITLLMKNQSGETLGQVYLDDVPVRDSKGINNVGGWKDENGSITSFGRYVSGQDYDINDGDSQLLTSTVLLATVSDRVRFTIKSQIFSDSVSFDLPVTN